MGICKLTIDTVLVLGNVTLPFFSCTEDNNLKLLVRKWGHILPPTDCSSSTDLHIRNAVGRMKLNVLRLQEDVVAVYLAGKPMINGAKSLYTSFSFVPQPGTSNE